MPKSARTLPTLLTFGAACAMLLSGCSLLPGSVAGEPGTGNQDVFTLEVGQCMNETSSSLVEDVPTVDCATPHDLEVYADFRVSGSSYDAAAITTQGEEGCMERFAEFVGLAYDESTLEVVNLTPTASSWESGDRVVSCMVEDPSGPTVGSLRGAAR